LDKYQLLLHDLCTKRLCIYIIYDVLDLQKGTKTHSSSSSSSSSSIYSQFNKGKNQFN